ncbi:MAG: hypothetical protein IPL57_10800 [Rubrivivax sp.]|nr:hypothetical protein [Rubrivivax sp.]
MATRKTTKKAAKSDLAIAGKHLGNASKEVGNALMNKVDAMGDALSASLSKAKKKVMTRRNDAQRELSKLVKLAELQHQKAQTGAKKAAAAAGKAVQAAEKKLEAARRKATKQLASVQASVERKGKALRRAIEKEAAALKKAMGVQGKAKAMAPIWPPKALCGARCDCC